MLFADLLSLHLVTFLMFFYSCKIYSTMRKQERNPRIYICTKIHLAAARMRKYCGRLCWLAHFSQWVCGLSEHKQPLMDVS